MRFRVLSDAVYIGRRRQFRRVIVTFVSELIIRSIRYKSKTQSRHTRTRTRNTFQYVKLCIFYLQSIRQSDNPMNDIKST